MNKKILIGSILAVVLLTLVSFSSVVGYNSVDKNPIPDLDCDGDISIVDVKPNSIHFGISEVFNIGDTGSLLDWEIESWPEWGEWTFEPNSGTGIEAGKSNFIDIKIIAPPEPNTEFEGIVTFINSNDPSDFCIVDISLITELKVQRIRELVQSIDLRKIIVNPDGVIVTLEEVSSILEEEDVRSYIEKSSEEDCGCGDDSSVVEWEFPILCLLLFPLVMVFTVAHLMTGIDLPFYIMMEIGSILNCMWQL